MTDAEGNPEYHQYAAQQASVMYQQQIKQQHQQQMIPRDESSIKLKRLDGINESIVNISQSLIKFFDELAKDKQTPNKTKATKQMFEEFLKNLKNVENDLLREIQMLTLASTGHPHEGSVYGARKDYDLAKMRLNLVCAQFGSLRDSLNLPLDKLANENNYDEQDDDDDEKDDEEKADVKPK